VTFSKDNPSPGEQVREFYRKQGEQRMQSKIISELNKLYSEKPSAAWSPVFLIDLIRTINEN
jgi:hypothetical protein